MEAETTKENKSSDQCRVLFTGTGERMIDNVLEFMPAEYEILRCQPIDTELYRVFRKSQPHAVIICLQSETREQLRVYDTLCENETYEELPVFVVGYEDDCTQFRNRLPMKNLKMFTRPVNRETLLSDLAQGVEAMRRRMESKEAETVAKENNVNANNVLVDEFEGLMDESKMRESERKLIQRIERSVRFYGRKSVLVVDDDVRMLNVIKFYLQDLYDVTVVPSGKLALKYIEKKPVDIVLLDYMMPEMDGPQVLKKIREGTDQPNVPVLFLTGVSDKDLVLRGLELRPNGYLLKPVSREALLEKVTEIVLGI